MNPNRTLRISIVTVVVFFRAIPGADAYVGFGTPVNLGPLVNNARYQDYPCLSADGLSLYFDSGTEINDTDLFVTTRRTPQDTWELAVKLGSTINSPQADWAPHISADGLELYFTSKRPGGDVNGRDDLWVAKRTSLRDEWGAPINLGPNVNTDNWDTTPCLSQDGLTLYFTSGRYNEFHGWVATDLYVTHRKAKDAPWEPSVNLGTVINDYSFDYDPAISPDGLLLLFSSDRGVPSDNSDTTQSAWFDIWMTSRKTIASAWNAPVTLGSPVTSEVGDWSPSISRDGKALFFASERPGGYGSLDIWQAPILPIVDFNGDGKVDAKDMGLLVDNWGWNEPLCDIGPFAWGDGVVDERDLMVFLEAVMTPGPHGSEVPRDVILHWISPSFAAACDVYFGTSFEAVNTASRTNPQSVLASQGQTAAAYDPAGLLEFNRTYYWRVDFVVPGPTPTIYRGPVLGFTTEAYAYPVKNIFALASGSQANMGPEKTVDGSGLDKSDGHSTDGKDMWQSTAVQPRWIQYGFDKVYALHELWVWNSNQLVEPFIGFGAKTVKIEYSTDGTTWTPLANVPEFAKASGQPGYNHNTTVSFGGVSAKYVKVAIEKGWGSTLSVGLSEVRFFYIPDRSAAKP